MISAFTFFSRCQAVVQWDLNPHASLEMISFWMALACQMSSLATPLMVPQMVHKESQDPSFPLVSGQNSPQPSPGLVHSSPAWWCQVLQKLHSIGRLETWSTGAVGESSARCLPHWNVMQRLELACLSKSGPQISQTHQKPDGLSHVPQTSKSSFACEIKQSLLNPLKKQPLEPSWNNINFQALLSTRPRCWGQKSQIQSQDLSGGQTNPIEPSRTENTDNKF